jgi:protein-S-isoprenylcysteine O-methyltransferase Ste14
MKIATFINAHKILVTPSVVAMMWAYGNWSTDAFLYLALHGTYTVLWLMKYAIFRDLSFEERLPVWMGIAFVFLPLQAYLIAPYLLISRHVSNPPYVLGAVVSIFVFGVFLHYVSDAQKYFTLRERPGLITDGFFRRIRNPNYLGEFLIYASYAALSAHWLPWLVLGGWLTSFFVRMRRKDRSLARYPEFAGYRRTSSLIVPLP